MEATLDQLTGGFTGAQVVTSTGSVTQTRGLVPQALSCRQRPAATGRKPMETPARRGTAAISQSTALWTQELNPAERNQRRSRARPAHALIFPFRDDARRTLLEWLARRPIAVVSSRWPPTGERALRELRPSA